MSKKLVAVVVLLLVGVGVGVGYYVQAKDRKNSTQTSITGNEYYKSLEQLPDDSSASLGVNSGTQTDGLGQIFNPGAQSQSESSGTDGNGDKIPSNPFDPATFLRYEKYKDGQSGLFADVKKGTGEELSVGKKAAVLYRGWLTNGQIFDQSTTNENGQLQTFNFVLGEHQVIPGWEQGLVGMKVGGVRLVIVPPAVGYGTTGQGKIPPNSVLIFQVELVAVQ